MHRLAPFLFFNGNTFAEMGRTLSKAVFADLPVSRLTNAASVAAHYVAGVLDRGDMKSTLEGLLEEEEIGIGDKVTSLKGSMRGEVVQVRDDQRLVIRIEGRTSTLICARDTLKRRPSSS